jgi:transposase
VAARYEVSLGMVKKLIQQRRHSGNIAPRYHRCGRKPKILASHERQLRALLKAKPDLTLSELQVALGLDCTPQAIHFVLERMGLSYKKRHSAPVNKTVRTLPRRAGNGTGTKGAWIPPGSSS